MEAAKSDVALSLVRLNATFYVYSVVYVAVDSGHLLNSSGLQVELLRSVQLLLRFTISW